MVLNIPKNSNFFITYIVMFIFWILLSWEFSLSNILFGLVGSFLVAYSTRNLFIKERIAISPQKFIRKSYLSILYIFYLTYQIIMANLDVAYRVLHPKMPIDTRVIKFNTKLESDLAKTCFANSITLTPGTITIDVKKDIFYVHALTSEAAESLLEGSMERKLIEIFQE
ncbi:MAG: Na+/H+ antiporter subunit E [Candidatus Altiarchaeales archaeon]|nr:MAG: Na+/H+ antiporter subunit E [Candidatus Altiarchaeales archaeon]